MTKARKKALAIGAVVLAGCAGLAALFWPRSAAAGTVGAVDVFSDMQGFVLEFFQGTGIPVWFAMANCQLESNFHPAAHRGGTEDSWGLMQINWNAHEAALRAQGITAPERLTEPAVNLAYWRDLVARLASQESVGETGSIEEWGKVRLRLAGIRRADFAGATAAGILSRYRPKASAWQARLA